MGSRFFLEFECVGEGQTMASRQNSPRALHPPSIQQHPTMKICIGIGIGIGIGIDEQAARLISSIARHSSIIDETNDYEASILLLPSSCARDVLSPHCHQSQSPSKTVQLSPSTTNHRRHNLQFHLNNKNSPAHTSSYSRSNTSRAFIPNNQ